MRLPRFLIVVGALILGFAGKLAFNMRAQGQNRPRATVTSHPLVKHTEADTPHVLAATYYSLNDNLAATLILSNQGPHPMEVKVSLFSLAGERFDAPPVTLERNTVGAFDLREWAGAGGAPFQEGSLQVFYVGMSMELGGVVELVDSERSLIFDEELSEPAKMFASSRLEGVWWLRSRESELRLAVSNTTEAPITTTVSAHGEEQEGAEPETLSLGAHETRVLDVRDLFSKGGERLPEIGGISVKHSGPKGGVLARGLIQEPAVGFSNVVEFYDPETAKSSRLDGAGLRIGPLVRVGQSGGEPLTQIAVARNVGDTPTVLKGRLPYTLQDGAQGVIDVPEIRLAPGQIRLVHLARIIRASGLQEVAAAGLEFEYSTAPGSVVMSALSVSADGNQVFRVPLVDAASLQSSTGQYPWAIDENSSTFVYIKNTTDARQQYTMFVSFEGGSYNLGLKTLEPRQTVAFDLRKLRDEQVPDADGKTMPLEANHGQVHWSVYGPHNLELIGRAEQVDIADGLSMTSACCDCCPDSFASGWVEPGSVLGLIGDVTQFLAKEQDVDCFGTFLPPFTRVGSWSSSNSSVATCDSNGRATAVGPGSANIVAQWGYTIWSHFIDPPYCRSDGGLTSPSGTCTVQKPGFLKVVLNTTDVRPNCPSGSCRALMGYRVLDLNGAVINRSNMIIRESFSGVSGTCAATVTDDGVWGTDQNGIMTQPDGLSICCSGPDPCQINLNQTFTVDGYPVLIMGQDGITTGTHNHITFNCSGDYAQCPNILITP